MKAVDKAKELVEQFRFGIWKNGNPNSITLHAKECAIIHVQNIIELDVWENGHNAEYGLAFWLDVKEEIQQL